MVAIREALPWSFIGLLLGLLVLFPIVPAPAGASLGAGILKRIALSLMPAFGVMSLVLIVLLSDRLASHFHLTRLWVVTSSIAAFALALPKPYGPTPIAYLQHLGASGLFLAIVVGLLVSGAFVLSRRMFSHSDSTLQMWLPNGVAVLVVAGIAVGLYYFNLSLADGIVALLHPLGALGDTYLALILIVLIETMLWTAGIHGPAVLASVVLPVYLTLQFQNSAAYGAHQPLPHIVVVSLFL
ncbi:MAG: hypothetical protein ABI182_04435, partial [Candidatus Baltobacteraceae bacterium]